MSNGGIRGFPNTPTSTVANGVWNLREQMRAQRDGNWPGEPVLNDPNVILYAPFNGNAHVFTGPGGTNPTYTLDGFVGGSAQPTIQYDTGVVAFSEYTASALSGANANEHILADTTVANNIGVTRNTFSLEFWVYSTGDQGGLINIGIPGSGRAALYISLISSGLAFYEDEGWSSNGSSARIVGGVRTLPTNAWTHIYMGFVRNGNSYTAINGTMATVTSNFDATYDFDPTAVLYLGRDYAGSVSSNRYQELIVRNSVPYTSSFTPGTSPSY